MYNKARRFFVSVVVVSIFLCGNSITGGTYQSLFTANQLIIPTYQSNNVFTGLINHEPIKIVTEQDFVNYSFPGNGTKEDPYRIENLNISTTENIAIAIYNISQYFIIQHCHVNAIRCGIYIESSNIINVSIENFAPIATVQNNLCTNSRQGIFVLSSWNAQVIGNLCTNSGLYSIKIEESLFSLATNNTCSYNANGICLMESHGSIVSNNTCTYNEFTGIIIWSSDAARVFNNVCLFNKWGIEFILAYSIAEFNNCSFNIDAGVVLSGSSYSTLSDNFCSNNEYGIHNFDSFHAKIIENDCSCNTYGIFFNRGSWYSSILGNNCTQNTAFGIYLNGTKECEIINNSVSSNMLYGVYLNHRTNDTLVAYNSFKYNNLAGSSQAYDDGEGNRWYDSEMKKGNYWSDWKGRGNYKIDGQAKSVDKYPLNENLERPDSNNIVPWLLSGICVSVLILLLYFLKRKNSCRHS